MKISQSFDEFMYRVVGLLFWPSMFTAYRLFNKVNRSFANVLTSIFHVNPVKPLASKGIKENL